MGEKAKTRLDRQKAPDKTQKTKSKGGFELAKNARSNKVINSANQGA